MDRSIHAPIIRTNMHGLLRNVGVLELLAFLHMVRFDQSSFSQLRKRFLNRHYSKINNIRIEVRFVCTDVSSNQSASPIYIMRVILHVYGPSYFCCGRIFQRPNPGKILVASGNMIMESVFRAVASLKSRHLPQESNIPLSDW